jgi:ELWxxDGT repeat protein
MLSKLGQDDNDSSNDAAPLGSHDRVCSHEQVVEGDRAMTKAVFAGFDLTGQLNPWVTDGTPAGTSELAMGGLFAGVATPDFTVLGGTTLFAGATTGGFGAIGLWVTDGTPAGTSELTVPGQAGGALDDLFVGGFDPNFTVLGSKAVFVGVDASVHTNLWVTDGTAAGTREISTPGAWSGGLFVNVSSPDFTVLGSKALFAGRDTSNDVNLWVTDGTPAGTRELVVAGAGTFGVFGGGARLIPISRCSATKPYSLAMERFGSPTEPRQVRPS